jgi:hypothetical protein
MVRWCLSSLIWAAKRPGHQLREVHPGDGLRLLGKVEGGVDEGSGTLQLWCLAQRRTLVRPPACSPVGPGYSISVLERANGSCGRQERRFSGPKRVRGSRMSFAPTTGWGNGWCSGGCPRRAPISVVTAHSAIALAGCSIVVSGGQLNSASAEPSEKNGLLLSGMTKPMVSVDPSLSALATALGQ